MAQEKTNDYEEIRKQRVLQNKRKFEDMGILNISKGLTELTKSDKKPKERVIRPKPYVTDMVEPRRSSRPRNPPPSYQDDIDFERPRIRKKSSFSSSSWGNYLARPLEEVKSASYEVRTKAIKSAEKLQSNLQSGKPSFIKSMVRSHVYSCFWLGLPGWFCNKHLPKSTVSIVLENEEGREYESVFIGHRSGLSGGWRAFALEHKLDDGDALVFELIEPRRFKVYTIRAFDEDTKMDTKTNESISEDEDMKIDNKINESESVEKTTRGSARRPWTQGNGAANDVEETPIKGKKGKKINEKPVVVVSTRIQRTRGRKVTSNDDEETPKKVEKVEKGKKTNENQSKESTKPVRASARILRTRGK